MHSAIFWTTNIYAFQGDDIRISTPKSRNTNQKMGVISLTIFSKIMIMNYQKPTLYIAALVMGCLSFSATNAQVRIVSESPSAGSSSTGTTRPTYFEASSPGSTGSETGFIRPDYFEATSPVGTSSQTDFTRPTYVNGVGQVNQQTPPPPIQIGLHPNPASEIFYIEINGVSQDENIEVTLFNDRGRRFTVPLERMGGSIRVSVDNLPRGRYLVQVKTRSQEVTQAIELI
jgi:hypothetical protein